MNTSIDLRTLRDLLAEYQGDRERMRCAPRKVQDRYDLVMKLLEEAIESRTGAAAATA